MIPEGIEKIFEEALVAELAFSDSEGNVNVVPMLPLYEKGMNRIIFTSSILFSKKIDFLERNNKVAIFFNNEAGIKTKEFFPILVKGIASIDDSDIHNKWTKYMYLWKRKEPYIESLFKQRFALPLFWERIIIEVKPIKIYAWKDPKEKPLVIELGNG